MCINKIRKILQVCTIFLHHWLRRTNFMSIFLHLMKANIKFLNISSTNSNFLYPLFCGTSLLHPWKSWFRWISKWFLKFIHRNTSDKGNKFSSYKFRGSTKKVTGAGNSKRGGSSSSHGGSSNSRGGRGGFSGGGLGFMPVPQPNRSFLSSGGGTFFGWLID